MHARITRSLIVLFGLATTLPAAVITLENTIPLGNLFLQPPVLTGAGLIFGSGGSVLADGFAASVSATLNQISVVVEYQDIVPLGVTGRSPMLLTLFRDNGNSPGTSIESWIVPLNTAETTLTIVTVSSISNAVLVAGQQYWLSEVPTDPIHTGIGWGLASSGPPGIQLPIATTNTGVNTGWGPTGLNIANEFSVTGTAVPEPATFGVSTLAIFSLIAGLRVKRGSSKT